MVCGLGALLLPIMVGAGRLGTGAAREGALPWGGGGAERPRRLAPGDGGLQTNKKALNVDRNCIP